MKLAVTPKKNYKKLLLLIINLYEVIAITKWYMEGFYQESNKHNTIFRNMH